MLFNSIPYAIFFPLVFVAYWLSPRSFRRALLLLASYFFYMSWIPVYGLLIMVMTAVNYLLATLIDRYRSLSKPIFLLGVVGNLSVLCYYKYANFLLESAAASFGWLATATKNPAWMTANLPVLDVILPLGISFFAFEFIHYLTDVFRGGRPIYGVIDFALFAAFFPSQIAGPIKRYQDFSAQLLQPSKFDREQFNKGLALLVQGLFKKVALSDNLALIANAGFASGSQLGFAESWITAIAFALQIYFDFSGYTDMGRGSAYMLGFSLPDNFNYPYLAKSLSDFWTRWHISLSSWLRDYLYIPLGGSRVGFARKCANLIITMLLGGLWHGAAWHFVVWGGFHGLGLAVNHSYDELAKKNGLLTKFHQSALSKLICWLLTLVFVLLGWVFFRAESVEGAVAIVQHMFSPGQSQVLSQVLASSPVLIPLSIYALYGLLQWLRNHPLSVAGKVTSLLSFNPAERALIYVSALIAAIGFAPSGSSPFIYFQF